jgi:hypothetical protein
MSTVGVRISDRLGGHMKICFRKSQQEQTVFNSQHHCGEQPCGYLITREK